MVFGTSTKVIRKNSCKCIQLTLNRLFDPGGSCSASNMSLDFLMTFFDWHFLPTLSGVLSTPRNQPRDKLCYFWLVHFRLVSGWNWNRGTERVMNFYFDRRWYKRAILPSLNKKPVSTGTIFIKTDGWDGFTMLNFTVRPASTSDLDGIQKRHELRAKGHV